MLNRKLILFYQIPFFNYLRLLLYRKALFIGSIALLIAFFSPVLFHGHIFVSDGQYGAYVQRWALWSAEWAAGWPLIADTPSMASYPIRIVLLILGFSFNIFVLSAYLITFTGTFIFLMALRCGKIAATTGSFGFVLSGWMLAHLGHTSMIHAASWLPWMLLAVERFIQDKERRNRWLGLLSLSIFLSILAGHLQITVYALIISNSYIIFRACHEEKPFYQILWLEAAFICGVTASSFVILPTLELVSHTFRDKLTPEILFQYSLPFSQSIDLIVPYFHGISKISDLRIDFWGSWNESEMTGYLTHVIWALACIGCFFTKKYPTYQKQRYFWISIVLLSFMLALGDSFDPGVWFTNWTPVINMFRCQARHLYEFSFALSILAAFGMQSIMEDRVKGRNIFIIVGLSFILIIIAIAIWYYPYFVAQAKKAGVKLHPIYLNPAMLWACMSIMTTIFGCFIATCTWRKIRFFGIVFLLLLLAVQSVLYGYQLQWKTHAPKKSYLIEPKWASDYKKQIGINYRALGMDGWESEVFNPSLALLHNVRVLGYYGPLIQKRIVELAGVTTGGWTRRGSLAAENHSLDIFAVKFIALRDKDRKFFEGQSDRWRLVEIVEGDTFIFENLRAQPRVWMVGSAVALSSQKILSVLVNDKEYGSDKLDLQKVALVEDAHNAFSGPQPEAQVNILRDESSKLIIAVKCSGKGLLIIGDAWYPGWKSKINGKITEVLRANYAMRAVFIPAGSSRVELYFEPPSFYRGVTISVLAILIVLGMSIFALFRKPSQYERLNVSNKI